MRLGKRRRGKCGKDGGARDPLSDDAMDKQTNHASRGIDNFFFQVNNKLALRGLRCVSCDVRRWQFQAQAHHRPPGRA